MYEVAKEPHYDLIKAAKKLTLPVQARTLVFDGESDTAALADFYFHEMRYGGKRIVDVLAESGADLTLEEAEMLEAHRHARCSLFEHVSADPVTAQIHLRDLLEPGAPDAAMTDINLSHSPALQPGDMLFTRLVRCADLTMGAGMVFVFRAVHRIHLLNAYEARLGTVDEKERSPRTFVFFFKKNRELGCPREYVEVV
jgi:hypothetical protein